MNIACYQLKDGTTRVLRFKPSTIDQAWCRLCLDGPRILNQQEALSACQQIDAVRPPKPPKPKRSFWKWLKQWSEQ